MASIARVALIGFGRRERAILEAFLSAAAKHSPAYLPEEDPRAADFIVLDARDAATRASLSTNGLIRRALVVGEPPCDEALACLPRPLNLMALLNTMDRCVECADTETEAAAGLHTTQFDLEVRGAADEPDPMADADAPPPEAAAPPREPVRRSRRSKKPRELATTVSDNLGDDGTGHEGDATGAASEGDEITVPGRMNGGGRVVRGHKTMDHILVVDDSDIALRFMATHLQRFGFQIHLARSGREAVERVTQRHFEFVFLDIAMQGLDGFQTCKAIREATMRRSGARQPCVVMLTARNTPADRLRAAMAGADGYLTKPLRELELLKVVGEREVVRHEFAQTAATSTRS